MGNRRVVLKQTEAFTVLIADETHTRASILLRALELRYLRATRTSPTESPFSYAETPGDEKRRSV